MRTLALYRSAMHKLFPQGLFIPASSDDSSIGKLLEWMGNALLSADNTSSDTLNNLFPDTAGTFLEDWERVAGLPLEGVTQTASERRDTLLAWLNISPYSNKEFFVNIAGIMGFTIVVEDQVGTSDIIIDKITNGGFDADSDWTKGTGWTIGSGVATKTAGTASDLEQDAGAVASQNYEVTFTVSNYTAGTITPKLGTTSGTARSANGTYVETISAAGSSELFLSADATFAGDIDNVSVKPAAPFGVALTAHQWRVISASSPLVYFKAGQSRAGDLLVSSGSNDPLEELINFFAPAHTTVIFKYI